MSAAAAAILDGMPDARDLHRLDSGGQIMIFAGPVLLFRYSETDKASRNLAVTSLRQLRFSGKAVAEATGLTPNYVATAVRSTQAAGRHSPVAWWPDRRQDHDRDRGGTVPGRADPARRPGPRLAAGRPP